jgi:hypothetical protein
MLLSCAAHRLSFRHPLAQRSRLPLGRTLSCQWPHTRNLAAIAFCLLKETAHKRKPQQPCGFRKPGLQEVSTVRIKSGKFYADWRDEKGRRRMKAFPTKRAASRHTAKMRAQTAGKKAYASARSAKPATRGPRRSPRKRGTPSPSLTNSGRSAARSRSTT